MRGRNEGEDLRKSTGLKYAQVNLFQSTLANALEADGTGRPLLRFVLESLRQLQRITVPGTTIPAVVMGGGAGWLRCLALDRQRIESTGGAKAGGQHLDAAMSEPRQRRADEQATRLRQLPSVDHAEVRTFVRCTTTIGSDNGSQWISPSTYAGYSIAQNMPAGYCNGYTGCIRQTDPTMPNRNSHGGSASGTLRVQWCFDLDVAHTQTVRNHFLRRAVDFSLRLVPAQLSLAAGEEQGDAARLHSCVQSGSSALDKVQCLAAGWPTLAAATRARSAMCSPPLRRAPRRTLQSWRPFRSQQRPGSLKGLSLFSSQAVARLAK